MGDIEDWREPLQKKAALENELQVKMQENITQRAVCVLFV